MKLFCLIAQFFLYCSVIKCLMAKSVRKSEPIDKLIASPKASKLTMIRFQDDDDDGIHGTADKDYPVLTDIPRTAFTCANRLPGYYADLETRCQVFHLCSPQKTSFLCTNGTIFNQKLFTCDWWYTSNCNESPQWFFLNANLYKKNTKTNSAAKVVIEKNKPNKTKQINDNKKAKDGKKNEKQQKPKAKQQKSKTQ